MLAENVAECVDAARALGAVGTVKDLPLLLEALRIYETKKQPMWSDPETLFVQAALRSLGRLGGSEAEETLIRFLGIKEWSCYAAEALGDCGTSKAVDALVDAARAGGDAEVQLHAQRSAEGFYRRAGFTVVGEPYEEAGIAHIAMARKL